VVVDSSETIAALSTPAGESGIAVIRLSGPEALSILGSIFRTKAGAQHTGEWEHRRLYHGVLVDASTEVIDEVMCAVMRGPDSYTGEDTVELSGHGNTLLVTRILNLIYSRGARSAEPGEFTRRAFINGKMDLIQAEAVADLIHARSELQRKVAQEQLAGGLSARIHKLADEIVELLANIEVNIDFIEENLDTLDVSHERSVLAMQRHDLENLLASAPIAGAFREGYRVAIAGPVNAGKSSLYNRLVGENRAIVTEVPGTTRDVLREPIVLEGLLFTIQDTAGLRGTDDRVESIGVDRAESAARDADVVVFIVDASAPLTQETQARLGALNRDRAIVALNKMDLPRVVHDDTIAEACGARGKVVALSALTGDGVAELERMLVESVGTEQLSRIARDRIVLNARLISLLERARLQLNTLDENLEAGEALELLAVDARELLGTYEAATGTRYSDDLLANIFSRFCIGK